MSATATDVSAPNLTAVQNILLVEDNPLFQQTICTAAQAAGLSSHVQACAKGSEALELLAQPDIRLDAALVDIGLPDMSGIDVIKAIRNRFVDIRSWLSLSFLRSGH